MENFKPHTLPRFEKLAPFWKSYFQEMDDTIHEDFWGNLPTFKLAEKLNDPYIRQLKEMGYCYLDNQEVPATYYQSLEWVFKNLNWLLFQGILNPEDILWPAKVFEQLDSTLQEGQDKYSFVSIGSEIPDNSQEVSIVKPATFVEMVSKGFFPLGSTFRAHTNQSSAEHDLAHFAGFISEPEYMKSIREAFRRIDSKMRNNSKTKTALESMNSLYSIRIYYMIEVFTIIPENRKEKLQELVEIPLTEPLNFKYIVAFLTEKAKKPTQLYQYLYRLYNAFPSLVNPVGGESRDILNRNRKFSRGSRLGTFFSSKSDNLESKFDGCSIYSLFQNGLAALENKRSSHPDFLESLKQIHAPFIGTLIGTSQLTIEDWVLQSVEEIPNPNSKLYQYLCMSGMWNKLHMLYWAYGESDYSKILYESEMHD